MKAAHTVWMSGLMAHQNAYRKGLNIFEESNGIIKFSPLLDCHKEAVQEYFEQHSLPRHPLESKGYGSIGCTHCTQKGKGREGRWKGGKQIRVWITCDSAELPFRSKNLRPGFGTKKFG